MRGNRHKPLGAARRRRAMIAQSPASQARKGVGVRHGDELGTITLYLVGQQLRVFAGGQCDHTESRRVCIDHGERAAADRSGGAEDRETLHVRFRR